ncbi:MAG TPA: hypothetical protein VMU06_12885 [Stellaceae bacterium]|nr:hypothetical protein [Stellaceae bacterium]
MSGADLLREFASAQCALDTKNRAELHAIGIPDIILARGLVGIARVEVSLDGKRYEPADEGHELFITPARVGLDPSTPEATNHETVPQDGRLVDLVAWSPHYPGRWATRTGLAAWLGAIEPQFVIPPAVPIFRSPLSWLRAGAKGLCILDTNPPDIYRVLTVCQQIEAEDRAHAQQLRRILEHPFKPPTVLVAQQRQARAA